MALSDGRRLVFRTVPHLSDAFSEEDINPLGETQKITAAPLGNSRPLLPESVDLALPDGTRQNFVTLPHLSDAFA